MDLGLKPKMLSLLTGDRTNRTWKVVISATAIFETLKDNISGDQSGGYVFIKWRIFTEAELG